MKNALGVSLGICALVWTYLALGVLSGFVAVWGGFIAWGAYFTNGKGTDNLQKTITATIFGAVLAGVAVIINNYIGVTGSFAWPIAVGVTVWGLTALAGNKYFANIPANVFGYAATFGLMLTTNTADMYSVTVVGMENPVILMSVSFVFGSLAGVASEKVAGMLG